MGPIADRYLVFGARHGDRAAFCRIYQKYRNRLLILAIALSNDVNIAEDSVQDTFVYFAEHLDGFSLTGSLKGYLAKCVANRVRYHIRSRKRRFSSLEEADDIPSTLYDPTNGIMLSEQLRKVTSALTALPPEQREVVVLHTQGEMKLGMIAKSLNVPVNTVKSRYRYGIDKLRSSLRSEMRQ
ncbi:MAG: sigma-70 family RNA polymerase sigma factor [Sedimentisphaerales bacterium]|nr:sigma-70 family RNA polymerase sigma factor [Sedimentisphaerales bacterium]